MRALLHDGPVQDQPDDDLGPGDDVEVTNIVDFAGWVSQLAGEGTGG